MTTDEPIYPQPLLDAFRADPSGIAVEHGDRLVTRGEVLSMTGRIATGLRAAGVGPGVGLAVSTALTPESLAAHLAAYAVGCRVSGLTPGYTPVQRAHILSSGVDFVLTDSADPFDLPVLSLPALLDSAESDDLAARGRPDDVARLMYTSGSTGLPKGCVQTYRAITARWPGLPRNWSPDVHALAAAARRYLLVGTLASPVMLDWTTMCLLGGGTAVIPTGDMSRLLPWGIERLRITAAMLTVPRLHAMLGVLREEKVDTGSLRAIAVSGSPISPHRFQEAIETFGPIMHKIYGQSEVGVITVLTPREVADWGADALSSVGHPHRDTEISIRTEEGVPAPAGATGEVFVRSPSMMSGYHGDPVLTRETLPDGWVRTRDLGHFDGHGLLHLVGRSRDVIIVNAQICYAVPIEDTLAGHADVEAALVLGAPDEVTGEAVHAFVVPVAGRTPDPAALSDLVRGTLGALSVPGTITVIAEIPQTPAGKPDKAALRTRYLST